MGTPHLSVGTATDRINLIGGTGYRLADWTPQAIGHQGAFGESALADYRAMESYRDLTATETITLHITSGTQNTTIKLSQDLRRALRMGLDYQTTNWQQEPVYLAARAKCETNTRYALVIDAEMKEDAPVYQPPFQGKKATMPDLVLVIEHGPWLENPPGEATCVQASGQGTYYDVQTLDSDSPTASGDDAYICLAPGEAIQLPQAHLDMGYITAPAVGPIRTGIRFPTVNVPRGATILSALITFEAYWSDSSTTVNLILHGDDVDNAAGFSTDKDLITRVLTTAAVPWMNVPAWVAGSTYNTPGLASIVQEIVNRAGWAPNNALAVIIDDNGSDTDTTHLRRACSWDHPTGAAPVLTVVYVGAPGNYGRAATCNNEVFLANKQSTANITHVYRNNGGAWENVGLGHYPYGIFPAAPVQNGDAIYYGIQNAADGSICPFCSLVFDIGTAAVWTGAMATNYGAWQYWNGGAWTTLTYAANALVDNTSPGTGVLWPFSNTGVNSVHWGQPSNWAANDPGMGVTGLWIRCLVVLGIGSVTVPTQQNRDVYNVAWGSVLIDDGQVPGDLPALLRAAVYCQSGRDSGFDATLGCDKVVMGLRSTDRGEDFSAYINLSNQQNPDGIDVSWGSGCALTADPRAVTGKWVVLTPVVGAPLWYFLLEVDLNNQDVLKNYWGTYHAYVRAQVVSGTGGAAGDVAMRLRHSTFPQTPSGTAYSSAYYNKHVDINELFDLGQVTFPAYPTSVDLLTSGYTIMIEVGAINYVSPGYTYTVRFHDLILIPVDEWAMSAESYGEFQVVTSTLYTLGDVFMLDVDGVTDPRRAGAYAAFPAGWYANAPVPYRTHSWPYSANGQPTLRPNKTQRLWMVTARPHIDTTILYRASSTYVVHSLQFWRNARYYSQRGSR